VFIKKLVKIPSNALFGSFKLNLHHDSICDENDFTYGDVLKFTFFDIATTNRVDVDKVTATIVSLTFHFVTI
jgi:hypothetical protein